MSVTSIDHQEFSLAAAVRAAAAADTAPAHAKARESATGKTGKAEKSSDDLTRRLQLLMEDNIRLKMIIADLIASLTPQRIALAEEHPALPAPIARAAARSSGSNRSGSL